MTSFGWKMYLVVVTLETEPLGINGLALVTKDMLLSEMEN